MTRLRLSALLLGLALLPARPALAQGTIVYSVKVTSPATHYAEIEATFPTEGRAAIVLMMPVWSPGFYRVEDYAAKVEELNARPASGGPPLSVGKPKPNRWRIQTEGASAVVVTYRLRCDGRSVTTNAVAPNLLVLNPGAALMTLADGHDRPHEVRLDLPSGFQPAKSGLDSVNGEDNRFLAPDYDTLVDSPMVAGDLSVREFVVEGVKHQVVDAGRHEEWNGEAGARDLRKIARGTLDYWGVLPYKRYVFMSVFRPGGGGLEHGNSTLVTSSPQMKAPNLGWLSFMAHEYFHSMNVKRLRPVELGPFDYEKPPATSSLWIAEGLTTYGANLVLARMFLCTVPEYLGLLSGSIDELQNSPGRRKQTLEEASLDVWNSGTSGVGRDTKNVLSYYAKGPVVGFLLDAKIQRATRGRKSLQHVMRLAYERYGGARGFTAEEFQKTAEEVANIDLGGAFHSWLRSTDELDYKEALDWFGLRFAPKTWQLVVRADPSDAQRTRLRTWLGRDTGK